MARKKRRPDNFYELLTCAWKGHALVGTDVAVVRPEDGMLVRERDGVRWNRCLRCDAWVVGEVPAEPVGRLTPKFHDILIENVTATGSNSAGTIVGLPESLVQGLTLKNVHIAAKTGLSIAYATVKLDDVTVKPEAGDAIKVAATAEVALVK